MIARRRTCYLECSKGTYVRSIAEDLGQALGCGAHVTALRRTRAGSFDISRQPSAWRYSRRSRRKDSWPRWIALLLPSDTALLGMPLVQLSESAGFYMRQGQPVLVPNAPCNGMVRVAMESGEFLGVGEILDDGRVAPRRLIVTGR